MVFIVSSNDFNHNNCTCISFGHVSVLPSSKGKKYKNAKKKSWVFISETQYFIYFDKAYFALIYFSTKLFYFNTVCQLFRDYGEQIYDLYGKYMIQNIVDISVYNDTLVQK